MNGRWLFALFLVSGFCALVYQVVWLRLAMAGFGVNSAMVAVVLSVFMAGLALGSAGGGAVAKRRRPVAALRLYAAAEVTIALSASAVPMGLRLGRELLIERATAASWGSVEHYLVSSLVVTFVLSPFCIMMGATMPLGIAALRDSAGHARSFSYLYLANVIGACLGTLSSAVVLIELYGFQGTLHVAAALNATIAAVALARSVRPPAAGAGAGAGAAPDAPEAQAARFPRVALAALFCTGFASMGLEVVWVRQFAPYTGTVVYAFATILATYLAATFAGSALYRAWPMQSWRAHWGLLGVAALLPLVATDPRLALTSLPGILARVTVAIAPLCMALGWFTPMLLDRYSRGDAASVGRAYAVNVVGCILGPLAAGFLLLPFVSERAALVLLALPLFGLGLAAPDGSLRGREYGWAALAGALAIAMALLTRDYTDVYSPRVVRRDSAATVVASGVGMQRMLLVNGAGMTSLTPITKYMAHLPLASLQQPPRSALALCFGMGVTFRSLDSWGIDVTAVELSPSVPRLFGFFHPGEEARLRSPRVHVVIDDARRFLQRTSASYDVITIDPPPPISAAGSSLLYSREFYSLAGRRLRDGGILQQWLPYLGDGLVVSAVTRALLESFPHVRCYGSVENWGVHYLASRRPIPSLSAAELARRLPPAAARDIVEWGPAGTPEQQFQLVLGRSVAPAFLAAAAPGARALVDDRPVNEYFLLRDWAR